MNRRYVGLCFLAIISGVSAVTGSKSLAVDESVQQEAEDKGAISTAERTADRDAIRKALASFASTFEARDAKSLAAHFTSEGEYENAEGVKLRGRDSLEQAFARFFSITPEVKSRVEPRSLRFLSNDSAIEEGVVAVQRGPAAPFVEANYTALVVREGGAWRLAMMRESSAMNGPSIDDLEWLIGSWSSRTGDGAEIRTTYAWEPGKKFIRMQFALREKEIAFSGTQLIGVDPATGMLHSWTFESDGGIGEADWYRDEDHWVLDAAGTLADGSTLSETNVLRRIDKDTFTWQSTNRLLNDNQLADLPPVKVSRVTTSGR